VKRAHVIDALPEGLTDGVWTCEGSEGSACDVASGTGNPDAYVDLTANGQITIKVTALVGEGVLGTVSNSATIEAPTDVPDPDQSNNTSTDKDAAIPLVDVAITKTDNSETATPGSEVVYTITVTNAGPSTATDVSVRDDLPKALQEVTWTCSCNASGAGALDQKVTMPANSRIVYTLTGKLAPDAEGDLVNTATAGAGGVTIDSNPGNNSAVDTDKLVPKSDIVVTKTDNAEEATPGGKTTYTVVVTNKGPSAAKGVSIADVMPQGVKSAEWTCAASEKSTCAVAAGKDAINTKVDLWVDGTATFTVIALMDSSATGDLVNTATATFAGDPDASNNAATDTDKLVPKADLSITKKHAGKITAGNKVTYTIVVSNAGPSDAKDAAVSDVLPAGLTDATWTCVASAKATCGKASGKDGIETTVSLAVGATATFTLTAQVDVDAPDDITNTASVIPPSGMVDPKPDNNVAVDGAKNEREADVSITKTDGQEEVVEGRENTYTIVVSNAGPSSAIGVLMTDHVPKVYRDVSWTCTASAGSTCSNASGAGNDISVQINIRPKGSVTFLVTGTMDEHAVGDVRNYAYAEIPKGLHDKDISNNTAMDKDHIWKEWLKHPPKKVKAKTLTPPATDGSVIEPGTGDLALTGSNSSDLLLFGSFFVGTGSFLVQLSRRRKTRFTGPGSQGNRGSGPKGRWRRR
jgi:uncharacterized repeat protein (TIGR01451 family)